MQASKKRKNERGFTLVEVLVVVAIVGIISAMAMPMYADALAKSKRASLISDGRKVYDAMMAYYADNSHFPPEDEFDKATLEPLTADGYLNFGRSITAHLTDGEVLMYMAPDIDGSDQQFLIVMRLETNPDIIVAAVHTNLVDDDGDWVDGVFAITADDLADAPDPSST